jgi:hypothetical protein
VYLSTRKGGLEFQRPVPARTASLADADFGEFQLPALAGQARELVFEMTAMKRCWFGEKRRVKLIPR